MPNRRVSEKTRPAAGLVSSLVKKTMPRRATVASIDFERRLRQKMEEEAHRRESVPASSSADTESDKHHCPSNRSGISTKDAKEGGLPIKDDAAHETERRHDASSVCFEDVFAGLLRFREENGDLTMPTYHPDLLAVLDKLSAAGIEELLEKRWDDQFTGLKAFEKEHGDCLVPENHPTLGKWVRIQREHFKLYEQGKPSPMTKKRFCKLQEIGGFGDQGRDVRERAKESNEDVEVQGDRNANRVKFMERGRKAHASSKKGRRGQPDKEAVRAELHRKRMLQRSLSKKKVAATVALEEEHDERLVKGGTANSKEHLEKHSYMMRSSSSSNLCPGSWECHYCSHINEPVGVNPPTTCKYCGNESMLSQEESFRLNDLVPAPVARACEDDINIESWSDLASTLRLAAEQSMEDAPLPTVHKPAQKEDWRRFERAVNKVRLVNRMKPATIDTIDE